eukprot:CAMPEP_0114420904 /NCGR_PEP_ID=MMETSP0103-20121206/4799_1 /TAXON_ID=37642 ORGANISM="Paraphysomonas imperforata, Strain PA2" /NCGR_SAMPLE_ID=MMETSP0103 /ASSEMBLY_ACC=CAM_ASM_000201 /LENGTH=858 /DNA_ID=CAMNT_0001589401 /DNA_START=93 /DNA_END=2669 /DNA_ORIENTATION=+
MPLPKRFVADAQLYAPPDIYEESSQDNLLRDISSAGNLGALHQISFLSLYAFEMFDNLSRLAEDVGSRIINATDRTSRLVDRLTQVESRIQRITTSNTRTPPNESQVIRQKKQTMKFLKVRSAQHIPSALNKMTNSAQINGLYADCSLPPQFWKLEALTFDDCLIRYSNPGLFFEEWLKVELLKQEENRLERKRLKKERKLAKKKRREEEALAAASGDLDPNLVRRKGLKDKRRKNKAEKKEKAREEAASTPIIPPSNTPAHTQQASHTNAAPRSSTTSNLFSSAANYGFKMQPPSPAHRPPPTQKHGSGKKPTKPPPSKPPPSKPPPNKPPPSRKGPTKPPPSRTPPTKPPPSNKPPTKPPPKQMAKPQQQVKPVQKDPPTSKPTSTPVQSKSPPKVDNKVPNDEGPDDLPPPDDFKDDDGPPPDDESDLPEDLPPPDDELPDDFPLEVNKTTLDENDEDEPPPPDDDEPPEDFMEHPPIEEDSDIIEGDDGPPVDNDDPPPDDEEPIIEDEDDVPPTDTLPPVNEEESEVDEDEEEDAFVELPPPVVPVVTQPIAPAPKRKQSILMIGRDKKKMAEEASANLQRLSLSAGDDVRGEFEHVIETFTAEEKSSSHLESLNESDSLENSKSDSVRRKSFLNSNLNLGMDLQAPTDNVDVAMTEDQGHENVEYNDENTEVDQEHVEEQEEGGDEYYNYDQTQYEGEQENENYDEYYQDGYFWNGTEWVVADEVHGENDGTVDGYEENNVEEEIPPENQQSALSLFGGGDVLASIRQGNTLRKVEPPERKVTAREGMLSMIKKGGLTLKKADTSTPLGKKPDSKPDQSDAIARLLSNRAQIAGSDSDSSDSDDSDSDDSYF